MPELQNGAEKEARGNSENPEIRIPPGIKVIDHLESDGYGIYELATGKPLMFVLRKELVTAPNPGAYFQAILDGVAATQSQSSVVPVEVPENLIITEHATARRYAIRLKANGGALKVVPWDNLPSDRAAAAQCMQWHVNDAAAQLKHNERPERSSAGAYAGAMIGTAVCVAGSAALGWLLTGDPGPPALVGVFVSVGLFWCPRRRST